MMKILLAGIAVFTALAFATGAGAAVRHHKHHTAFYQEYLGDYAGPRDLGGRPGYPTSFRMPAHPLVWDCVHVVFPQCSRGFDGLNDGSFK